MRFGIIRWNQLERSFQQYLFLNSNATIIGIISIQPKNQCLGWKDISNPILNQAKPITCDLVYIVHFKMNPSLSLFLSVSVSQMEHPYLFRICQELSLFLSSSSSLFIAGSTENISLDKRTRINSTPARGIFISLSLYQSIQAKFLLVEIRRSSLRPWCDVIMIIGFRGERKEEGETVFCNEKIFSSMMYAFQTSSNFVT